MDLEEAVRWGSGTKVVKGRLCVLGLGAERTKEVRWVIL